MPLAVRLLILCIFFPRPLWSQKTSVPVVATQALSAYKQAGKWYNAVQESTENDRKALSFYRRTIALLDSSRSGGPMLTDSYIKCGLLQMSMNGQEAGATDFRKAVESGRRSGAGKDSMLFQPYLFLGSIVYGRSDLDSARYFYRLAEGIHDRYPGVEGGGRLFNKFGALYYETGDYAESIHYFEKALAGIDSTSSEYTEFAVNYKNNIATALLKLGRYDAALDLLRGLLKYHVSEDGLLFNMGKASAEKKSFTGALAYFRAIRKNDAARCNALAQVFLKLGQKDSAKTWMDKALVLEQNHSGSATALDAAITRQCIGNFYKTDAAAESKEKAARYFQQAIRLLDPSFTDTALSANPGEFSGLLDFSHLFEILVGKAEGLAQRSALPGGERFLPWSLDTYVSALSLARHIERTYFSDDARLFLKNQVNPAVAQAITIALGMYNRSGEDRYLDLAFGFSENSKASVLQSGVRNLALSSIPGLPADLLQEEKKLKFLHARLSLAAASVTDSALRHTLQARIRDNAIALTAVQEKMDANAAYHQLKYYSDRISMSSLQSKLDPDEAILSYYYTKDSLFCFYATHNGHGYTSVLIDSGFFPRIRRLRSSLETPGLLDGHSMTTLAGNLSGLILGPVIEKVRTEKKWIIVPFNETGYIPVELLPLPGETAPCLLTHAVSYAYSGALLGQKQPVQNPAYRVLAMAPFAVSGSELLAFPSLPASADEIRDLPGTSFTGPAATKAVFLSRSGEFPVIHLATHAVASDADAPGSYIAFYGQKNEPDTSYRMYEQEVFALDLKKVGIIMLSACETGKGQLVNGEGILSLSRAFSYAGCRRVLTSLWKADDRSTAIIMARLHHYLRQGSAVDEALQQAKTDYLEDPSVSANFKTPFFWAHLVLIGDRHALVPASFPWLLWIVCGGLLFSVLAGIILYKKRPGRKNSARPWI